MVNKKVSIETRVATPVNILWEGILLIPIFGVLSSERTKEIIDAVLAKVVEVSAKTIILDILGVEIVDSSVANQLVKMTKAVKLLGAKAIISGITPPVAATLVEIGIELGEVITRAQLVDAVSLAFERMNLEVVEISGYKKK